MSVTEDLGRAAQRVANLAHDAHPGLYTWRNAMDSACEQLARLLSENGYPRPDDEDEDRGCQAHGNDHCDICYPPDRP